jgi:hypothetical protein
MNDSTRFLLRYYANNLVLSKIGGRILLPTLAHQGKKWEALHNKVAGHDYWLVVGNGPSLRIEDLELLNTIPAVASNKINLLYNKTDWRPLLYTMADPLLLFKTPREHYESCGLTLTPHSAALLAKTHNKLYWRGLSPQSIEKKYLKDGERITPISGILAGSTITCPNIMLAMWAGAKTIFVIGCDHFYKNENHNEGTKKTAHLGNSNHFDPNYRTPGEIVNAAPVEWMNRDYALMRRVAESKGVRIINISRRTALDAFELGTVEEARSQIRSDSRNVSRPSNTKKCDG